MSYSQYDPSMQGRAAWNAGKTVGTKRPLTQKQIWAIRFFSTERGGYEIGRCLILRSTASYAGATS
jgi:hypothetical protein